MSEFTAKKLTQLSRLFHVSADYILNDDTPKAKENIHFFSFQGLALLHRFLI